jgi:membrane-bound lytic murein transglycosylase D
MLALLALPVAALLAAQPSLPAAQVPVARDGGVAAVGEDEAEHPTGELEQMRALEESALEPATRATATLRATPAQLGEGTVTRDRLEGALEAAQASGEELAFELPQVLDLQTFDVSTVQGRYDIPVEMQPLVSQYIRFFQGAGRFWFRRWMSRSSRFIPVMTPILEARGLPRDLVYLAMIESGFNTQARSWARAVGPWQFISETGRTYHLKEDFWVDERRDPLKSTAAAAAFLGLLHEKLGHWYLAWAGYNTGGGRVQWMIDTWHTRDFWELSQRRGFARETKHYVPKLIACALVARHPEAFGFSRQEFDFEPAFEFETVELVDPVDLEVLAQASGATLAELQELNPELKRWCTPPATEQAPYLLRLPRGRKETFLANFPRYAPAERLHFAVHRVQRGDTLSHIALAYHSAQEAILRMNHLPSARSLRVGVDLVVPVPSAAALKAGRADVALERQVVRARRSGLAAVRPEDEIPAGTITQAPGAVAVGGSIAVAEVEGKRRVTYGVARGDTLWTIARRFDVHVAELHQWNPGLAGARGLKVGSALLVWPGARAELPAVAPRP